MAAGRGTSTQRLFLYVYNETDTGFEVGFEDVEDHAPFMAEIETRMVECCTRGQLTPETVQLLGRELVSSGIWADHEHDEKIRTMTTPADAPSHAEF